MEEHNKSDIKQSTTMEQMYIDSMDEKTKQAYIIAKKHLHSSFNLKKSIGFKKFKQSHK